MLNRAFRTMGANIIVKLGFFIGDLHRNIEKMRSEQFNEHNSDSKFTAYRVQSLSKADSINMMKT